jgi:hypothetical protein
MITGEKNRAHNCLTVSNLKLDDVFTDIFGKSSHSITEHILQHPEETFDVHLLLIADAKLLLKRYRLQLMVPFLMSRLSSFVNVLFTSMNQKITGKK